MPRVLSDEDVLSFRERLCEVAARQFAEHGFAKVSMRSLADELSVSRMTPYRYFNDKAEILATVRANGFKLLVDQAEDALGTEREPVERMKALAAVYFEFAIQHSDIYRLMFELSQEGESAYPEMETQLSRLQTLLIKASTVSVDAGIIQKDATLASQLFWAGMHGVVTLHLSGKLQAGWSVKELSLEMTRTLFQGMVHKE